MPSGTWDKKESHNASAAGESQCGNPGNHTLSFFPRLYFCWLEAGGPVTNDFHISLFHSKFVQQFLDLTHLLKRDVAIGSGRIRWKPMGVDREATCK